MFNKKIRLPRMTMSKYYNLYTRNTDLFRAIEILRDNVGSGGYDIVDEENQSLKDTNRNEYMRIRSILEYGPGFHLTKGRQIRDYMIAGMVFTNRLVNAGGETIGYQVIDPKSIELVVNEFGDVVGYTQTSISSNTGRPLDPQYIEMMTRSCDPDNEVLGMSVVKPLFLDVLSDESSQRHNYNSLEKNKIPAHMVIMEEGISDEQRVKMSELMKEYYQGTDNAGKLGMMPGVKDIIKIEQTLTDMEFKVMRDMTTQKVSAATGVPKQLMGYDDSTFNNVDAAKKSFITSTVRPLERVFEAYYNNLLAADMPEGYRFKVNDNHIDKFKDMIDIADKGVRAGLITPNEGREMTGKQRIDDPMADELQVSKSQQLLADIDIATEVIGPETTGE